MHHHCNFYVSKISTSLLDIWLLCSSTLPVIQNPEIHIKKLYNGTPHPYDFSLLSYLMALITSFIRCMNIPPHTDDVCVGVTEGTVYNSMNCGFKSVSNTWV